MKPDITNAALQGQDKKAVEKQYGKEVSNRWNFLLKQQTFAALKMPFRYCQTPGPACANG